MQLITIAIIIHINPIYRLQSIVLTQLLLLSGIKVDFMETGIR